MHAPPPPSTHPHTHTQHTRCYMPCGRHTEGACASARAPGAAHAARVHAGPPRARLPAGLAAPPAQLWCTCCAPAAPPARQQATCVRSAEATPMGRFAAINAAVLPAVHMGAHGCNMRKVTHTHMHTHTRAHTRAHTRTHTHARTPPHTHTSAHARPRLQMHHTTVNQRPINLPVVKERPQF